MKPVSRIPITAITVFGASLLLLTAVGTSLFLGFNQAAESTRQLWADQSESLIDNLEESLNAHLRPVRDQALWVANKVDNLDDPSALDEFMLGSLAATPQVAVIAIIKPDGSSRRWVRGNGEAIDENWSHHPWLPDYLKQVEAAGTPVWRAPIFTETISGSTLLHDVRLVNPAGEFIGVLAQIVPIQKLSRLIAREHADTGLVPFVLYNRNFVLAHPTISSGTDEQPLISLDQLGDLILERIWTPDEDASFISEVLEDTQASGIFWGDDYILFLYRDITHFGPAPWTIGAYLNTNLQSDDETERLITSLIVGLAILVIAIVAAIIAGRKISNPIQAIVSAADGVESGDLESVKPLAKSGIRELDDAGTAFNNMVKGLRERQLMRDTLGRFVPEKVAASLLAGGGDIEVQQSEATILFCDIESFTQLTEQLGPVHIVKVLNDYFSAMVEILETRGGVVTQFQGDAILATFNVPVSDSQHASHAVESAAAMLDCVKHQRFDGEKLNIRIGINTGPVVAGAIGARGRLNYTVHGDAVNLAARLESMNKEFSTRLMVSETTVSQVSDCEFQPIGELDIRGQSKLIQVYTLASLSAAP
ncbi:MAG: adenylate/guanylate cyclase domain-containing protein [Pseudomonadota bacterium]